MLLNPLFLIPTLMITAPMHDVALPDLKIGDALPASDVKMMDVSNKEVTLAGLKQENGLLVIFSCNTCPFVVGGEGSEGWEGRYPALGDYCRQNKIGMVLVNSNEAKRDKGDSFTDMQNRHKQMGYTSSYVLDRDHTVADAFGARTTPHVFLFSKDLKLSYKGAIDDNVGSATAVTQHWLKDAMAAQVAGKAIDPPITRNMGCSIKRVQHAHPAPAAQ